MKVTGTLRRVDLGPGAWLLVADDGRQFQLVGKVGTATAGARVEVDGDPENQGVSFAMTAPIFRVRELTRI